MGRSSARSIFRAILVGGFVAAFLDILDAITFFYVRNGIPPIRILQSIASGLLGHAAYTGGIRTALLGVVLHITIALIWAILFVLCAQFLNILFRQAFLTGIFYGLLVYLVMNSIVLPHSRAPMLAHAQGSVLLNGVLAILFLVGLPISFANRRFAPRG